MSKKETTANVAVAVPAVSSKKRECAAPYWLRGPCAHLVYLQLCGLLVVSSVKEIASY